MTKNVDRIDNPSAEAERLLANPELFKANERSAAEIDYQCTLTNNGGYFELQWSASITGSNDWVGLFPNSTVPNGEYIGGNNWQWASRGNRYRTSTPVQGTDYEVRYLVWNTNIKDYQAVARAKLSA
jgi:hypothetical protein